MFFQSDIHKTPSLLMIDSIKYSFRNLSVVFFFNNRAIYYILGVLLDVTHIQPSKI